MRFLHDCTSPTAEVSSGDRELALRAAAIGIGADLSVVGIRIGWIPLSDRSHLENVWRDLHERRERLLQGLGPATVHSTWSELEQECVILRAEAKSLLARAVRASRCL